MKPATDSDSLQLIIEQPHPPSSDNGSTSTNAEECQLIDHPKLHSSMTVALSEVAQIRSVLKTIGARPDHESVDNARTKIAEIESMLSKQLDEIVSAPMPDGVDRIQWQSQQAEKEEECRRAARKEKHTFKGVVQLDEMHGAYEKLLREAEDRLLKINASVQVADEERKEKYSEDHSPENEEVAGILQEALEKELERIELSGRQLRFFPEAFGRLHGLIVLNLSGNQLQVIPDSIAGLENLEELDLSTNILESLPESFGLLNLKVLNVSGNKLNALPDNISYCRSLVELDVSFNNLIYLPTNIGYELVDLRRLSVHLNKIRSLPTSVCEMKSLQHLDAHFNELCGLPHEIGRLTNLEILNLNNNFSDLTELPDTIGDLINLRELDISNNQIHALPDTFGRLDNLIKLNLDQNPLVIPPMEIVNKGVKAVKVFMAKRWLDMLVEEEQKSMLGANKETETGWLTRSTSWLNNFVSGVSGEKPPRDSYLDQEL